MHGRLSNEEERDAQGLSFVREFLCPFELGPGRLRSFLRAAGRLSEPRPRRPAAAGWQNLPESSSWAELPAGHGSGRKGEGWGILGFFVVFFFSDGSKFTVCLRTQSCKGTSEVALFSRTQAQRSHLWLATSPGLLGKFQLPHGPRHCVAAVCILPQHWRRRKTFCTPPPPPPPR